MPTYDYVCDACAHELELFQAMTEAPKRKCPACGALKLRRRVGTGAGILFKGSGFYQTDYRSDSYKKAETAARNSSSESKPTSESKSKDGAASGTSESKPAAEPAKPAQAAKPAKPVKPTGSDA